MAKIDITKTELVWPGKYNEDGTRKEVPRVSLPFQVIETVNESRATREVVKAKGPSLFDTYEGKEGDTFAAGWRNKLIWGDNLLVMGSLLEKFAGKVDLIYIDPPFATGTDFSMTAQIGESGQEIEKDQSAIEEKAYRDTWGAGVDSYISMMSARIPLLRELLSQNGVLFLHCDWHMGHLLRCLLDEAFGSTNFLNEIVWQRTGAHNDAGKFGVVHDVLLFYAKSATHVFNPIYVPHTEDHLSTRFNQVEDASGRRFFAGPITAPGNGPQRVFRGKTLAPPKGRHWSYGQDGIDDLERRQLIYYSKTGTPYLKQYMDEYVEQGRRVQSIWSDLLPSKTGAEVLGYPTQKPEGLLERVITATSNENALVADFFCGSGTTLAVAEKLGRRWIGCDLGRWGIHTTRKRLLGIENCKPFEVLNLGKYERQYWQGVTFGTIKGRVPSEQSLYEYLAFILKLYGAQPLAGMAHLHGKKGRALVHIGAVDAPVTITEIDSAVDECVKLKQTELHVLGWEWEMGLYDLMVEASKKKGVKLLLLQIPREVMEQQAAAKGDVSFFELAYLDAEVKQPKKLTAQVALKDFVVSNTELIPEEVRNKVKKWSDYIDYWSVDWDFRNDTFMQGWVAYRTRQDRKLPLLSDAHSYGKRPVNDTLRASRVLA